MFKFHIFRIESIKSRNFGTKIIAAFFNASIDSSETFPKKEGNIVSALSRGIGFNTIDLELEVPFNEILGAVTKHDPNFLCISASMRSTIPKIEEIIDLLNERNCREDIKVMLGGYSVTEELRIRLAWIFEVGISLRRLSFCSI